MNLSCYRLTRASSFLAIVCASMLLVISFVPTFAQSANNGSIAGVETDPSGAAVAGAEVKIIDTETNSTQTTTTNEVGRYVFVSIAPGVYSLNVSHAGFTSAK